MTADCLLLGYDHAKRLRNGELAGLRDMIYTTGLFVGLHEAGYRVRYCYSRRIDAENALVQWDGLGDPPGQWIVAKGEGPDRGGPGA